MNLAVVNQRGNRCGQADYKPYQQYDTKGSDTK